jgi:hypothetical protein
MLEECDTCIGTLRELSRSQSPPLSKGKNRDSRLEFWENKSQHISSTIFIEFLPTIPIFETFLNSAESLASDSNAQNIEEEVERWVVDVMDALFEIE